METVIILIISLAVLGLLFLLFGGLAGFIFACGKRKNNFDPTKMSEENPGRIYYNECEKSSKALLKNPSENVVITAQDGAKITARLFPQGNNDKFIILMHGYRSDWVRDFGSIAGFWYDSGYSLLIINDRAHEYSGGRYICYGVKERYDLRDFAIYLSEKFPGCKILLHGISMGGATVMMSADTGLPPEVVGIIDDCGYTTPYEIIADVSKKNMHLPAVFTASASLWARLLAHISLKGASAVESSKNSPIPKLIIHGEKDDFVPYQMGVRVYQAASGDKKFLSVPDAAHALSFYTAPDMVKSALTDFAVKTMV